jgi:hypothetical protein
MIKYTPVSSFADIEDADEYNAYNRIMSIMNASNSFSPEGDIDLVSDLVFEPTIIGDPVITPKTTTDVSPDQSIKIESEGKSKLEYTPSPGEDPFKESYLKAVGEEDNMYKFFSLLAKNESGYNPKAKNPHAPAYGYFQFMQDGVDHHNISNYGDVDIETFLNTPEIQINAARSLADSFLSHLNEEDLAKMAEKGITRSGALGGMWLGGYGGLKRYLYNNENISDKHWSPSGAGIDMKTQIKRYNGLFKKGGRIEKASLGTIFSTNEPRDQRGSGVELSTINNEIIPDFSSFYYNIPVPRMHNYKTRRVYDLNQVTKDGDRYYDIIHNRTRDAKNALKRNGFVKDLDFLSQILALQSIRETGWIDRHSSNNYGGYTEGEGEDKVKLSFSSPDEFWDHHISNLNSKWGKSNVRGPWYDAKSLDDYINRINNPDLNTTKENYNKYNYNRRIKGESEQYLYAPIWDNKGRNYLDDIKDVVDRYFYYYNH